MIHLWNLVINPRNLYKVLLILFLNCILNNFESTILIPNLDFGTVQTFAEHRTKQSPLVDRHTTSWCCYSVLGSKAASYTINESNGANGPALLPSNLARHRDPLNIIQPLSFYFKWR